ncbi:MAG: DUF4091 domain-containing protein [Victivallales bacterium]|nr:DUF4091 domain-containing protein [Victivallales bacterium]
MYTRCVLLILIALAGVVPSAEFTRACVLGGTMKADFNAYGVLSDTFERKALIGAQPRTVLQVCESLDNSLLAIFPEQVPVAVYRELFSRPEVCRSIKSLLQRGGTLMIGPVSWQIVSHWPKEMTAFFRANGLVLLAAENYRSENPEKTYTGIPAPGSANPLLRTPNALAADWGGAMACRYLDNLPAKLEPLLVAKGRKVPLAAVQENACGKGRLIYTYAYSTFRTAEDAFIENLIVSLYGRRPGVSARTKALRQLGVGANPPAATGELPERYLTVPVTKTPPVIDGARDAAYEVGAKAILNDYKTGAPPKKGTTVELVRDGAALYLFFACDEPNPDAIHAKVTAEDGRVWEDDCVELLLTHGLRRAPLYHLIVSAAGTRFDEKDANPGWDGSWESAVGRYPGGWTAELKLPLAALGFDPAQTPVLKGNICREEKGLGELTTWSPATAGFADRSGFSHIALCSKEKFAQHVTVPKKSKPLYDKGFLVWSADPYEACFADTLPADLVPATTVHTVVARGEREGETLLVSNLSDRSITLRVEPDFHLKDSETRWQELVLLKEAVPRLNPFKERQMDPLVGLNEANLLTIPPYETRKLWLRFQTNLPAGTYAWGLTFVPIDSLWPPHRVEVQAEVLPLTIPEKLPFMVYNFGPYGFSWAQGKTLRKRYLETCREYGFSHVITSPPFGALTKAPQGGIAVSDDNDAYLGDEALIRSLGLKWVYSYGVQAEFDRRIRSRGFKGKLLDEEWTGLFTTWATRWFAALRGQGYTMDDFLVPIVDEVHNEGAKDVLRTAQLLKRIAPGVQLYQDPATWTTFATVRLLDPVTDVWIPWEPRLSGRDDSVAELAFYRASGKPFCPYLCAVNTQVQPLLSYYRFRGMRSWLAGAHGFCLWSFNSWRGNDWAEFDQRDKSGDNCLFYHGDNGPIPSIRAEAFREAVEDFWMLGLAKKHVRDDAVQALVDGPSIQSLMDEGQPKAVRTWRTDLLRALSAAEARHLDPR